MQADNPATRQRILEASLADLEAVVGRWGSERVIVENPCPDSQCVPVIYDPFLINDIINSTKTGFLFDISHARLAARELGMDEDAYLRQLPLDRTEEIHITGIKRMQGEVLQKLLQNRPKEFDITDFIDKDIDHQAMSDDDFQFLAHVYSLIESGACREPWIASMEHGGIGPFWELTLDEEVLAQQLPYGAQRRLEIARSLASQPTLLLLDEPTAGMNPQETAEMTAFIKDLRDSRNITILLIEHDMRVVMDISDQITVLDYGLKIAEGKPSEIQSNQRVIEAYLGPGVDAMTHKFKRKNNQYA